MPARSAKPCPPSNDKRWKLVDATMRRHGGDARALIETLHTIQEAFGYLDDAALAYVAASLRTPASRVYGVATFYHFFSLHPPGKHTCVVCTGTACYIKGAPALEAALKKRFGVSLGETTPDGELSAMPARCLGACGLAPAVVIDGAVSGQLGPEALVARLEEVVR